MIRHPLLIVLIIVVFAAAFRLIGLNWDQNQHLHPDERFLTMVTQAIGWPTSLSNYLDTSSSPANPNNVGFDFYVYGTLPLFLVKLIATVLKLNDYINITLVGRALSGLLDTACVAIIYFITRRLGRSEKESLLASGIYAFMALPIQLAHFYAVDTYLVFFILLAVYFALSLRTSVVAALLSGVCFGLAFSSKISAVLFLPILLLCFIFSYKKHITKLVLAGMFFSIAALISIRLTQPYLFAGSAFMPHAINPKFTAAITQLQSFNDYAGWFPPAVQWLTLAKGWFPFENLLLWGLGLPLGVLSLVGLAYALIQIRRSPTLLIPLSAIILIFTYQSFQFNQPMRYFYPLYPFLAITTAIFIQKILTKIPRLLHYLLFAALLLWPLAVLSIYTHPHTRVAATDWASLHIPAGSIISCEVWDDCVPLNGTPTYRFVEFPLYDPESPEKWLLIQDRLNQLDYLILSSNRLYGSISSAPKKYPQTTQWYTDLFMGRLGFVKIAEFTSRPHLPFPGISLCLTPPNIHYGALAYDPTCSTPGISFVDDYADESWTVYDHPKVTVFKRVTLVSPATLPR